jgi:hypothetical protein
MQKCELRSSGSAAFESHHSKSVSFDIPNSSFNIPPVPLAAALGVGDERLLELIGQAEVMREAKREVVARAQCVIAFLILL